MRLVVADDHELLLHHRDDLPGVAHPGRWAGFGGAVEDGENPLQVVRREGAEETGVEVLDPIFLVDAVDHEGDGRLVSLFYLVGGISVSDIDLREGAGVGVHAIGDLDQLDITPFVRHAIDAHLTPLLADRAG